MKVLIIFLSRTNDDFTCSLQQEHTLSQEELMAGVKKGILKGFLELDEKLRKIPEVCVAFCPQWPWLRRRLPPPPLLGGSGSRSPHFGASGFCYKSKKIQKFLTIFDILLF